MPGLPGLGEFYGKVKAATYDSFKAKRAETKKYAPVGKVAIESVGYGGKMAEHVATRGGVKEFAAIFGIKREDFLAQKRAKEQQVTQDVIPSRIVDGSSGNEITLGIDQQGQRTKQMFDDMKTAFMEQVLADTGGMNGVDYLQLFNPRNTSRLRERGKAIAAIRPEMTAVRQDDGSYLVHFIRHGAGNDRVTYNPTTREFEFQQSTDPNAPQVTRSSIATMIYEPLREDGKGGFDAHTDKITGVTEEGVERADIVQGVLRHPGRYTGEEATRRRIITEVQKKLNDNTIDLFGLHLRGHQTSKDVPVVYGVVRGSKLSNQTNKEIVEATSAGYQAAERNANKEEGAIGLFDEEARRMLELGRVRIAGLDKNSIFDTKGGVLAEAKATRIAVDPSVKAVYDRLTSVQQAVERKKRGSPDGEVVGHAGANKEGLDALRDEEVKIRIWKQLVDENAGLPAEAKSNPAVLAYQILRTGDILSADKALTPLIEQVDKVYEAQNSLPRTTARETRLQIAQRLFGEAGSPFENAATSGTDAQAYQRMLDTLYVPESIGLQDALVLRPKPGQTWADFEPAARSTLGAYIHDPEQLNKYLDILQSGMPVGADEFMRKVTETFSQPDLTDVQAEVARQKLTDEANGDPKKLQLLDLLSKGRELGKPKVPTLEGDSPDQLDTFINALQPTAITALRQRLNQMANLKEVYPDK